jgi:hypothetical protein
MSKFAELLAELNAAETGAQDMAKSLTAAPAKDDKAVVAAAAEAGALTPEEQEAAEAEAAAKDGAEGGEGAPAGDDKDGKPAPIMAKSEAAEGADLDAKKYVDATEMLKAMQNTLDQHGDVLSKAFTPLMNTIKSQGEMIKSLHEQMQALGGQGRGRRAVVQVAGIDKGGLSDAGTLAKSQAEGAGLTPAEFMVKANAAFDNKKITGLDLTAIDVAIRGGQGIPPHLVSKVALAG